MKANDARFGETLLKYSDCTGKKDSEIHKKANSYRKLFSKIRTNPNYNPSKPTASTFDRSIEYYIINGNYDIYETNEALLHLDQSLLGC